MDLILIIIVLVYFFILRFAVRRACREMSEDSRGSWRMPDFKRGTPCIKDIPGEINPLWDR